MDHKLRIKKFQNDVNELKHPDVLLIAVGHEDNGDESIIVSSSIDDPRMMLSGLAQLCADDDGFYTLFKSAVEIAESHFQEEHFDD
jgi:hypothetical protein